MKFSVLYEKLIRAWPAEISLSDAEAPTGTAAQQFPKLSVAFREIEEKIAFTEDHWSSAGQWSFFQVFHAEAMALYQRGASVLNLREVPVENLSLQILHNLENDDWEAEKQLFRSFPE